MVRQLFLIVRKHPAWKRHVESWESEVDVLITLGGLKRDPGACLREMYTLFDRSIGNEVVDKAVNRSSFENMARVEQEYGIAEKHGANNDFTFMRKGNISEAKEHFTYNDYQYLWETAHEKRKCNSTDIRFQLMCESSLTI